jgi:hypothetical protein
MANHSTMINMDVYFLCATQLYFKYYLIVFHTIITQYEDISMNSVFFVDLHMRDMFFIQR